VVFGTAILGANYAADGDGESHTYTGTSTFDFGYRGDLLLGLIDDQLAGKVDHRPLRTGSGETRQDKDLVALRGASVCAGFEAKFESA
jgi:hypothetical protein